MKKTLLIVMFTAIGQMLSAGVSGPTDNTNPLDPQPSSYDFKSGGIYYQIRATAEPEVTTTAGDTPYKGKIVIPDQVTHNGKTYKVTRVAGFNNSPEVSSITIPKYVRRVSTFYGSANAWYNPSIIKAPAARATAESPKSKLTEIVFNALNCDTCDYHYEPLSSFVWQGYKRVFPSTVTKITIGEGVGNLPRRCFHECSAVKELILPKSLKTIGHTIIKDDHITKCVYLCEDLKHAEWRPENLSAVQFGSSFRSFCEGILTGSDSLDVFVCPESVKIIQSESFRGKIRKIVLPEGLERIEEYAFRWSRDLKEINIPTTVTYIGSRVFWGDGIQFDELTLPAGISLREYSLAGPDIKKLIIEEGFLQQPDGAYGYPEEVVIKSGEVTMKMFELNRNLRKVTVCDGVDRINPRAFATCPIKETILPKGITYFGKEAFSYTYANGAHIYIDNCTLEEEAIPLWGNVHLGKVTYDRSINLMNLLRWPLTLNIMSGFGKSIPSCFALRQERLEAVSIDEGIETIGLFAFAECPHLLSVTLPKSLRTVESHAFAGTQLHSLTIPAGVQTIEDHAFCNIVIEELTLSEGLKTIGESAFENAWPIKSITLPDGLETIGDRAFADCNIFTLKLPSTGLKSIGEAAFRYAQVKELELPRSLVSIGDSAFYLSPLEFTLPRTVKKIGRHAFVQAKSVKFESLDFMDDAVDEGRLKYYVPTASHVTLPDDMEEIPPLFFMSMHGLVSVDIPEGVRKFHHHPFMWSGLKSVTLPSTTVYVHPTIFELSDIETVYCRATVPPSDDSAPASTRASNQWPYLNTKSLFVPEGCKELYESHPYWSCFGKIEELHELGVGPIIDSRAAYTLYNNLLTSFSDNIRLYSLTGKLLFSGRGEKALPKGVYIITDDDKGKNEKIVID